MVPAIILGDKTSGGGTVIQGSPASEINGQPMARYGDKATCQVKGHPPIVTITDGDAECLVDNMPAAFHMASLSCGCKVIGSQTLVFVKGSGSGSSTQISEQKQDNSPKSVAQTGDFNEHFVICDKSTGKPVSGFKFGIEHVGKLVEGELSKLGKTSSIHSENSEPLTLKYLVQTQIGVRE